MPTKNPLGQFGCFIVRANRPGQRSEALQEVSCVPWGPGGSASRWCSVSAQALSLSGRFAGFLLSDAGGLGAATGLMQCGGQIISHTHILCTPPPYAHIHMFTRGHGVLVRRPTALAEDADPPWLLLRRRLLPSFPKRGWWSAGIILGGRISGPTRTVNSMCLTLGMTRCGGSQCTG